MLVNYSSSDSEDAESKDISINKTENLFKCTKSKIHKDKISINKKKLLNVPKRELEIEEPDVPIFLKPLPQKSDSFIEALPSPKTTAKLVEVTFNKPPASIQSDNYRFSSKPKLVLDDEPNDVLKVFKPSPTFEHSDSANTFPIDLIDNSNEFPNNSPKLNTQNNLKTSANTSAVQKNEEIDWEDVIKKTTGVHRRKIAPNDIKVFEISEEDIVGDRTAYLRNLTLETPDIVKNPLEKPSSTDKNKHQINYLAYQAKQREIELKNKWSRQEDDRRQSRSRYGF